MPVPQGVQISLNGICLTAQNLPSFDMQDLFTLAADATQPVLAEVASMLQLRDVLCAFYDDSPYIRPTG